MNHFRFAEGYEICHGVDGRGSIVKHCRAFVGSRS